MQRISSPMRRLRAAAGLSLLAAALLTPAAAAAHPLPRPAERARAFAAAVAIDWRLLARMDYRTGQMPPEVKRLDGQQVRIPGFMVPLEDGADGVTEFLLVPTYGACIHTPPPPPNQIVYAIMPKGKTAKIDIWNPVWIEGELRIKSYESPYGEVGYQMVVQAVKPYKVK